MCSTIRTSWSYTFERQAMNNRLSSRLVFALLAFLTLVVSQGSGAEADSLLTTIKAVGREGSGNGEASKAWRKLVQFGPAVLPALLAAFDDADATQANWLRTAVDTIAERALAAKQALPAAELEQFVLRQQHNGAARRLAYE